MAIRIPLATVVVVRDGKRVIPTIGKAFDFTESEIADIDRVNKNAIREPIVETGEAPAKEVSAKKTKTKESGDEL